jgi:hypothetical protein
VKRLIVAPFPHPDPREFLAVVDMQLLTNISAESGLLILPNDPIEWKDDISVKREEFRYGPNGLVSLWLTGWVGYRDEFDEVHATPFLMSFIGADAQRSVRPTGTVNGFFRLLGFGRPF